MISFQLIISRHITGTIVVVVVGAAVVVVVAFVVVVVGAAVVVVVAFVVVVVGAVVVVGTQTPIIFIIWPAGHVAIMAFADVVTRATAMQTTTFNA